MRVWAFVACAVLSGCELYVGEGDDDDDVLVDAGPAPDAFPECGLGLRCSPGCAVDLPCTNDSGEGRHTVCGRLWDVETGAHLSAATGVGAECGAGGATEGPCTLDVRFYDALVLANDPVGATPLPYESLYVDDCGRYRAHNIEHPATNSMAIAIDDDADALDEHRLTAVAFSIAAGALLTRVRAPSLRSTTDTSWTSQLGVTDGSVVDHGAALVTYRDDQGAPIAGIAIADGDAGFADLDSTTYSSPVTAAVTGVNGGVLVLRQGGLPQPGDCNAQATSVAGMLIVSDAICTTLPD